MKKGSHARGSTAAFFLASSVACFLAPGPASAASGPIEPEVGGLIDLPMYRDPELPAVEHATAFHPRLPSLWTLALRRPDVELRRQALRAFERATAAGMAVPEGLTDQLIEVLADDPDATVRAAAAGALVTVDDPAAAAPMLEASHRPEDRGLAPVIDPALARWNHQPAVEVWQARVADTQIPLGLRVSAARSLGVIGARGATETLTGVALDAAAPASLRLAAADALSHLADDGLVASVMEPARGTPLDRLVVARMLAGHDSGDARLLLDRMIMEEGQAPAVTAEAARSLLAIDPAEVAKRHETLVKHPDPGARRALAQALLRLPGDDRQPHSLSVMLDDADVEVRHTARQGILAAAAAGRDVAPVVSTVLAGGGQIPAGAGSVAVGTIGWRGLEQAALLAGTLDHEANAQRLVELLRHDRAEVRLAAAAALRQIAVPDTLPAMLARAEELAAASTPATGGLGKDASEDEKAAAERRAMAEAASRGRESTQLFMAFGEMGFADADTLARTYVPKSSGYDPVARGAAVYALGKLHEDRLDTGLASQLAARLADTNPLNPEMTEVRRFAAIALGRMKAQAQLPTLQRFLQEEESDVDVGGACRWAITRITGEELPPPSAVETRATGYFLEPAD